MYQKLPCRLIDQGTSAANALGIRVFTRRILIQSRRATGIYASPSYSLEQRPNNARLKRSHVPAASFFSISKIPPR